MNNLKTNILKIHILKKNLELNTIIQQRNLTFLKAAKLVMVFLNLVYPNIARRLIFID